MTAQTDQTAVLPEKTDESRLAVYRMLTQACTHLYSKNKLQEDKFAEVVPVFVDLAKHDPLFLAHLTSWAFKKGESKDLMVMSMVFNALSDADGQPFFPGASKRKPNLRAVSAHALQEMAPNLAYRALTLFMRKFGVPGELDEAYHFPTVMQTAYRKYLRYREQNPKMIRGAKGEGLGLKLVRMYRRMHVSPTDEVAAILRWKQRKGAKKGGQVVMEKAVSFEGMSSSEIAEEIRKRRLAPHVAIPLVPKDRMTLTVARAILDQSSGNQVVINQNWFRNNGFMDNDGFREAFLEKAGQAKTAVDRIDTLARNAGEDEIKEMAQIRSARRKQVAGTQALGKIFMHIDKSSSMRGAIDFAKDRASIFAECVGNPEKDFAWGLFGYSKQRMPLPRGFTREDFHEALYGVTATDGSTDCFALWDDARRFGADIDVWVTDQGHNVPKGGLAKKIRDYHQAHPDRPMPKAAIIVYIPTGETRDLEVALKEVGIPFVVMDPSALTQSALVGEAVRNVLMGELAVVNEIMESPLIQQPKWWDDVSGSKKTLVPEAAKVP